MNKMISKTLMACAVTATLGMASAAALAQTTVFPDFTVNETFVPEALKNSFTADKITGNYVEVATFNPANAENTNGTFNVSLKWNAGQFVAEDGNTPTANQLGKIGTNTYGLYALYQADGFYSRTGSQTSFFFYKNGTIAMYLDPSSDTVLTDPANGAAAFTRTNADDDIEIGFGVPTSGEGLLNPALSTCTAGGGKGINCGSFGTASTFELTSEGSKYFTAPNPFYNLSFQSGQLNNFTPAGTVTINGSLDVIFDVPEPTTVALLGLGLLGLGMSRRRKQA